jgi:hypothetical protein
MMIVCPLRRVQVTLAIGRLRHPFLHADREPIDNPCRASVYVTDADCWTISTGGGMDTRERGITDTVVDVGGGAAAAQARRWSEAW